MLKKLLKLLIKIGVIAVTIVLLNMFVVQITIIHSNDMYPAVRDGQLLVISKISEPKKDDIVSYKIGDDIKIGRILTGEGTVEITEYGNVLVDGNDVLQTIPFDVPQGAIMYPCKVAEDEIFIMNDYRETATDSRLYGPIKRENVIGKLVFAMQYRGF